MLIRPSGAVSVGDIDIGLGKRSGDPRELSRFIQDLKDEHLLLQDIKLFLFQEEERFGGIVHKKPHDRIVDGVVDGESENINSCV